MVTLGVDEVGRGCWAGPLVAGAVILGDTIQGLRDSKKLPRAERERLSLIITDRAKAIGIGWVAPSEIDAIGLTAAVRLAMQRAIDQITLDYEELIIDGNFNFFPANSKAVACIKADDSVPAVSAASIVAKVARDDYMRQAAVDYPEYGFETNVGYGTGYHQQQLRKIGITRLHRQSYKPIKALLQ